MFNEEIAFTKDTKVPVIKIDDDWKTESTDIVAWVDELFPEKPLFGDKPQQRNMILELDTWVSDFLIHGMFRGASEKGISHQFRQGAWRLAAIISSQTPLPEDVRNAWPEILKSVPFIKKIADEAKAAEKASGKKFDLLTDLSEKLGAGPFLGELSSPSIADFSAYQQLTFNYQVGITADLEVAENPNIKAWLKRLQALLPKNPLLVPDYILVNPL